MYKGAADKVHHLGRTGSHSTKPSATGVIRDIPATALEPEAYYNTLKQRWDDLQRNLYEARERVHWLKTKLRSTLPHAEYTRYSKELQEIGPAFTQMEQESGRFRPLLRAAALESWATVHLEVARLILDRETRERLEREVTAILGRTVQPVKPGQSRESENHKRQRHKRDHFKRSLRRFALNRSGDNNVLVYSTEKKGP